MPPKPPPKPPHEMHGPKPPPKPPHEKHPPKPHHKPPHERAKEGLWKNLGISVLFGSAITLILAVIQHFMGIPINVILPVSAPIWVGSTTLIFTALSKMH